MIIENEKNYYRKMSEAFNLLVGKNSVVRCIILFFQLNYFAEQFVCELKDRNRNKY